MAVFFPVFSKLNQRGRSKPSDNLNFQYPCRGGGGGAVRSPVVAAAAGRGLGERRLRLFFPLWHARARTPVPHRELSFNMHPKVGVHA